VKTGSHLAQSIRKRPIAAFLVIVFAISYPLGMAFNVFVSSTLAPGSLLGVYLPRLVTVWGPAAAALLVAACGAGSIRVSDLLRSCRLSGQQAALVILISTVGVVIAGAAFALSGVRTSDVVHLAFDQVPILLLHFVVQSVVIGLGEEIGWRGWLLPSLAEGRTFGMAAGITGLLWTIWHAPVFLSGISVSFSFGLLIAALSVILAWVWKRSAGSIALVATAHGAANAPFVFFESLFRERSGGVGLVENAFRHLSVLYVCVAVVLVAADHRIWAVTNEQPFATKASA
jgi:membrane protease YdiL (CAAX protease family)